MSSTYDAYYHHQFDYRQPIYQPPHHPIGALDLQQSYPPDGHFHPQHHPYLARHPSSWDQPWLRQTTAYQQSSSYEPDLYSSPPPSCWDLPWLSTQQGYLPYDQPPSCQLSSWVPPQTRQPPCWEPPVQPPAHRPSCWEPPRTATTAANQPHQNYQQPPSLSRSDRSPPQASPAQPDANFGPSLYAASDTYAPSSFVLLKTSSLDVLESTQKENLIVDCDRVEKGFDDSTEKILDSSAHFCGVEKVDIDESLEAREDDVEEERKIVDKEKSNVIMKDDSGHVCDEENEVPPQHLGCFLDYDGHTLVPTKLVDSMVDEHLSEGNDRIEGNGEDKDRDRVDRRKSLVLDVDINEEPIYKDA